MQIFWENIQRYPRFLISSVSGLIIILIGNIVKQTRKNRILGNPIILIILIITLIFLIFNLFMAILNI